MTAQKQVDGGWYGPRLADVPEHSCSLRHHSPSNRSGRANAHAAFHDVLYLSMCSDREFPRREVVVGVLM